MKKLRLVLILVLVLALCGCGGKEEPAPTQPAPTAEATEAPTDAPTEAPTEPEAPKLILEPVTEANVANYRYELTEAATFKDIDRLAFSAHMPVVRTVVDGTTIDYLYSYTGELLVPEGCTGYEYFDDGRVAMYTPNNTRLVNVYTGEVYLESPEIGQIIQMNDRYYFTVHNGYGQVFDLEKMGYIDGLKVTELTLSNVPKAVDDTVFEKIDYGTYRVYLGDGTVFGEIDSVTFTENGFLREVSDGLEVYDSSCNLLRLVEGARTNVQSASDDSNTCSWRYFKTGEFLNYNVIDINGEEVIPGTFTSVEVIGDYIVAGDSQELRGLYLADGTKLLDHNYESIYYSTGMGVLRLTAADGTKQVYVPGCGVWDLGSFLVDESISDGRDTFMIAATGETVQLEDARELIGTPLVTCSKGLVETFNGTTVLEAGYDFVTATEDHIYVREGDNWTVYSYDLVKE